MRVMSTARFETVKALIVQRSNIIYIKYRTMVDTGLTKDILTKFHLVVEIT